MTDMAASDQTTPTLDTGYHDRRLARRLEDPEFRKEYERELRQIKAVDQLVHELEALRAQHGVSKAELARAIDKHPAAVRRLLTASGNPELKTVVAIAEALDADVKIVPRKRSARRRHAAMRVTAK
jgi:DNA-binding phage protein